MNHRSSLKMYEAMKNAVKVANDVLSVSYTHLNTAACKLSFCEMRNQMIMARSLPEEVTNGTLEGDIIPGDITFFRLQSTSDAKLTAYVAQGEVLPVATRSFGAIGIFAIPQMGRFYRHWLIRCV